MVESFQQNKAIAEIVAERKNSLEEAGIAKHSKAETVYSTKVIQYAYSRIQRKAFGFNNDDTCSAVATTLALEYIDWRNEAIVPTKYHLEDIGENKPSASNIRTEYPKAHAFHRFLVSCGMGAASFEDGIRIPVVNYKNSSRTISNTGIRVDWKFLEPGVFSINELNAERPTMMTTTIVPGNSQYNWHTMLIYGYRRMSDGSVEFLVHTGWYNTLAQNSGDNNKWRMPYVLLNSGVATYQYRFIYNGM